MTPEQARQKVVKRENWIKLSTVATILIVALIILLAVPGMLVSFLLAFVIAYMFKPTVNYFERRGLSRTISVIVPFMISIIFFATASNVLIPRMIQQASSLQSELPKYVKGITDLTKKHTQKINKVLAPVSKVDIAEGATRWIEASGNRLLVEVPDWIGKFFSTLLLAPFFAFFMLRDGRNVSRKLLSMVPNNLFEVGLNLLYQINRQLGGFIRAKLLESILVGVVVWVGLYFLGFPYAAILAFFAGLTNLIPYLGPVIGAVPGIIVALVNQDPAISPAVVGAIYLVAQIIDMLFIVPLVVAKIVDLHPVTVVIVIIIGSQVMGVLGMIISVPAASIIKLTFSEFYNHIVDFRS
jgi:putative permease